jgi:hypothetical protein
MMQNCSKYLRDDPLPWLLEAETPSVRYWTLVDILERPSNDPDVLESRAAIAQQPLVKQLFALQHLEGHWGDEPAKPYSAEGAITILNLLHLLAVPPDKRTAAGVDSCLKFCQNEYGGFSMIKTQRSGIFPCITGEHLPDMLYFGFGDDPRIRRAFAFLIDDMAAEKALDCGRYNHRDCLWGAIAALKGLTVLPDELRSARSQQVVERLANTLLDARYDFGGEHKRWLTFGVPRYWDLLSMLKVLTMHGFAADARFEPFLQQLLERQDGQGRWLCGSVSRTWPLEQRNRPSKWVTLDALRVLKRL